MAKATEVVTGKVRLSYVNLFQPREDQNGKRKYSVTLLIPKSDTETLKKINDAIQAAAKIGLDGNWNGTMPPQLPTPIHDGDGVRESGEPFGDECKGHWVMTASANENHPPEVVDQQLNKVLDATAVYSGCYARVFLNFYPYGGGNTTYKKGVGVGLGPVQKVADGEVLGGSAPKASCVFGVVSDPVATGAGVEVQGVENPFVGGGVTAIDAKINPITGLPM